MLVVLARTLLFAEPDGPTPVLLAQAALMGVTPLVLAGPIGGFVADRWPRKQVLVSGQALRACLGFCAAVAVGFDSTSAVLAVFVCALCATRVLFTARVASVRHLVRQHELVAADSLMLIVGVVAGACGATLFGVTMMFGSVGQLVIVSIGHFAAAYGFDRTRAWLGGEGQTTAIRWRAITAQLACGRTRYALASTTAHRLLVGVVVATVALDIDGRTGGSASGYALTLATAGVAAFAGSVTSEWVNERFPRRSLTIGCFAFASFVVSPLPFVSGPVPHLVATGVVVFLFQNLRVASDATIQANASPGSCGRVFAAYDVAFNFAYVVGLVGGLAITTNSSVDITLGAVGPSYLVGAVAFALLKREDSRRAKVQGSSDCAPGTDVLAQYTPSDKRERIEYGGNENESTGGSAVPYEVPQQHSHQDR
jgi:predicted MFS family arabinose efflux permease